MKKIGTREAEVGTKWLLFSLQKKEKDR